MALAADSRYYKGSGEGVWPGHGTHLSTLLRSTRHSIVLSKKFKSREASLGGRIICLRW